MPKQLLIGTDTLYDGDNSLGSEFILSDFLASVTGIATELNIYIRTTYGTSLSVYEGNAFRDASAVLKTVEYQYTPIIGWNAIDIGELAITSGKYYRLGGRSNGSFSRTSTSATNNITYLGGGTPYPTWVAPDPVGSMTSWVFAMNCGLSGWIPPAITSIDDDTVKSGDTGIITGTDFMDSDATLELCNSSVYTSSTIRISQTITLQSDTSITFTVDNNDRIFGNNYLFLTTDLGQINVTGLQLNIGRTLYVFVENQFGSVNSVGHPITVFE